MRDGNAPFRPVRRFWRNVHRCVYTEGFCNERLHAICFERAHGSQNKARSTLLV